MKIASLHWNFGTEGFKAVEAGPGGVEIPGFQVGADQKFGPSNNRTRCCKSLGLEHLGSPRIAGGALACVSGPPLSQVGTGAPCTTDSVPY